MKNNFIIYMSEDSFWSYTGSYDLTRPRDITHIDIDMEKVYL